MMRECVHCWAYAVVKWSGWWVCLKCREPLGPVTE